MFRSEKLNGLGGKNYKGIVQRTAYRKVIFSPHKEKGRIHKTCPLAGNCQYHIYPHGENQYRIEPLDISVGRGYSKIHRSEMWRDTAFVLSSRLM